jgi:hypothetical protein
MRHYRAASILPNASTVVGAAAGISFSLVVAYMIQKAVEGRRKLQHHYLKIFMIASASPSIPSASIVSNALTIRILLQSPTTVESTEACPAPPTMSR